MAKHNAENERIKRRYFDYLREAKRLSETSVDQTAAALDRFEAGNGYKPYGKFHVEQAISFKRKLADEINPRTGKPLSKATLHATLTALKNFITWLSTQSGYRRQISYSDGEYFNLSAKDRAIAVASRERPVPTLEQINQILECAPATTHIEKRDRAIIAFAILSGCRDGEIAAMRLKHVDIDGQRVIHDAREINTKFSKSWTSWFFPVGELSLQIVGDWAQHLTNDKLYGPDDPLFPSTEVGRVDGKGFTAIGLKREHWSTAEPIRRIFRAACERTGFDYFNPHSFRKTLAQLGERLCHTPEEFKAWSQNLGHERVMTTFISYGSVAASRQKDIMARIGTLEEGTSRNSDIRALAEMLHTRLKEMEPD
jgi:integrase